MGSNYRVAEKKKNRGMWPFYGLLMALSMGGIAYVLGPRLYEYVSRRSPNFSIGTLSEQEVILLFSAAIFLVLMSVAGLVVAIFAPKRQSEVKDRDLARERQQRDAERRARKKRNRELDRKMREEYRNE